MRISPDPSFGMTEWTIYIIFIVVIGGIGASFGSLERPILGAAFFQSPSC
ncbi:hypothetical protein [Candidatus Rhodoblastus alkanivorans]|uniref:Uncharacterized protein n=1 Tax=Candidatus Rhodoblastus alkanivorans TaxID=2954117 RepID=A0ABS9Z448_9HYPH|nr:hypothetical protein [Candidatus Rhodoblastus alkanivorans]MCI4682391.1 hypothetical protein [Candidatus Rhodoblastus alkanivorans]